MHIDILTGGTSHERDIAIRSAHHLESWIISSGYTSQIWVFPEERDQFLSSLQRDHRVIPMFHGVYGEDGVIQGFLEVMDMQCVGPSVGDHALCIDKYRTNLLVSALDIAGLSTPKTWRGDQWKRIDTETGDQYIIKPNTGGSSEGLVVCEGLDELHKYVDLSGCGSESIIQELIIGREFTVGVYTDTSGSVVALPIIEILQGASDVFGYAEKYESQIENEVFVTDAMIQDQLARISISLYGEIGLRGIVRMDFRYREGVFYFLEINTIPGFTEQSFIPQMWLRTGKTKKEYVDMLVKEHISRD